MKACPFDSIHVVDGVACVNPLTCKACGKCVEACPKHLIELIPYDTKHVVKCSSKDKGKDVMKHAQWAVSVVICARRIVRQMLSM